MMFSHRTLLVSTEINCNAEYLETIAYICAGVQQNQINVRPIKKKEKK